MKNSDIFSFHASEKGATFFMGREECGLRLKCRQFCRWLFQFLSDIWGRGCQFSVPVSPVCLDAMKFPPEPLRLKGLRFALKIIGYPFGHIIGSR